MFLSKVDTEQQRTVRQDSLWFEISFLMNFTEVVCSESGCGRAGTSSWAWGTKKVRFVAVKQI